MSPRPPAPGLLVAGKYRLLDRLGGGGMGEVFRAENLLAGRPVALKLLRHDLAEDKDLSMRFFQEAQAVNRIRHPNIVDVIDAGFGETGPYLVMECLEGESTAAALARLGRLAPDAAAAIALGVLGALEAAHRVGIIHRDLKPENVYLHRADPAGPVVVKLLDFGIAKVLDPSGGGPTPRTHTGVVFGTPDYLSPEQASGEQSLDGRSDLFAVGVLLFELLTGERPFRAASAVATAYRVVHAAAPTLVERGIAGQPVLDAVIARSLRKRPDERYAAAADFARELEVACPDARARTEALARLLAGAPSSRLASLSTRHLPPTQVSPSQSAETDGASSRRRARAPAELERSAQAPPSSGPPFVPTSSPAPPGVAPSPPTLISGPSRSAPPLSPRAVQLTPSGAGVSHVRGSVLRAVDRAIVARFGSEARDRIIGRLPESLADEFEGHALTSLVLYRTSVFEAYAVAAGDVVLGTDVFRWRELGRAAVEGELASLLKPLMRAPDAPTLLKRTVGVLSRLLDFGSWSVRGDEASGLVVHAGELGAAHPALRQWLVGATEQTMRTAGWTMAAITLLHADAGRAEMDLSVTPGGRRTS